MISSLPWRYDEFKSVGRDYGQPAEVAVYDSSHADFRDVAAESDRALDLLAIAPRERLVDFGCGTGTFAIQAARRGAEVLAVDVSSAMLTLARAKAAQAGVSGIDFQHAGFLTADIADGTVDAIASTFAFHHLPDFWKGVALRRLHGMLKPGGRFYLHDVVIEEPHALENIAAFIAQQEKAGGAFLRDDAEGHFRDEYSTYDWVMDGLLARAGFALVRKQIAGGVIATYLCAKN